MRKDILFSLEIVLLAGLLGVEGRGEGSDAQQLQILDSWDGSLPPPAPPGVNKHYSPVQTTADAARTWDPVYPTPYYVEKASAMFEPACPMKELDDGESFQPVHDCRLSERHDVAAELTILYAIVQGPKADGVKSIGDAPSDESPSPLVRSVTDGDGVQLKHSVYRQGKEWWVHYTFAKPTAIRQFYTVKIVFQLRRVLTGSMSAGNTFRANWLQEWNSPVKNMHLVFTFPKAYSLTKFSVLPGTSLKGDDEPSLITSVCCGEEVRPNMERCTNDDELGSKWAKGLGACANQTVQLATTLAVSKAEGGEPDEGIPLKDLYRVYFSPGMVEDLSGDAVNHRSNLWIFWLVIILLVPVFAALVYFTYSIGKHSADDGGEEVLYQKAA